MQHNSNTAPLSDSKLVLCNQKRPDQSPLSSFHWLLLNLPVVQTSQPCLGLIGSYKRLIWHRYYIGLLLSVRLLGLPPLLAILYVSYKTEGCLPWYYKESLCFCVIYHVEVLINKLICLLSHTKCPVTAQKWKLDTERSENKKDLYQNTRKSTTNSIQENNKQQICKYKIVEQYEDR